VHLDESFVLPKFSTFHKTRWKDIRKAEKLVSFQIVDVFKLYRRWVYHIQIPELCGIGYYPTLSDELRLQDQEGYTKFDIFKW